MDPARFRRLMDVVGDALELDESARDAWLATQCADDEELLADARALLDSAGPADLSALARDVESRIGNAALWIEPVPDGHPTHIGSYEITRVLGEGGMGVVYEARQDEPLRRDVAVKLLHASMQTPRIIERFEAERQTLASLDHPSIAHVIDAGTSADGRPWFAMELVGGVPITEYCDNRHLGIHERLLLFQKLLAAIQHAHQKAIIHRDIKPSNVLVTQVDGDPRPKVIDFGIARIDPRDSARTTAHTAYGAVLGTIEYMSPEQALSPAAGVGTRSDIYSLGVLLYELLTGKLPFPTAMLRSASPVELERILRDTEPVLPSRCFTDALDDVDVRASARGGNARQIGRSLRGDLDTIIGMAMRKDPARRYASVAHMSDDIDRFLDGHAIEARPATVLYRAGRFATRHRFAVSGTAIALLTLFAFAITFTLRLAEERNRARVEAEKANRIAAFLQDIFHVPNPASATGSDVSARQLLDDGAERITAELADQPEMQADLLNVVGMTYRGLGLWDESERRLEAALALERSVHNSSSEHVATLLHNLGTIRIELGKIDESEVVLQEALAIRTELLGSDDPATASTMGQLALALRADGKYEEAETIGRRGLAIHRATLGNLDLETGTSLHNLAFIARSAGNFEESEELNREALALRRQRLDPSHPDLLSTASNLASVLEQRGAYVEAESLFREVLDRRRERLGTDHQLTITSINNLAYMFWRTGWYGRADSLFAEAVPAARRVYGEPHTTVAIMLNNYGVSRRRAGDLARAEQLHREALAMNRAQLGADHPRIASDMDNLGRVLLLRGHAAAADSLHSQAYAMRTRLLAPDHPDLAESMSALGDTRMALGDLAAAERFYRDALALRLVRLGAANPRVATSTHELGVFLARAGRFEEAEQVLQDALAKRQSSLGDSHPDVAATLRELGSLYIEMARHDDARRTLTESRRIAVGRLDPADPDVRRIDELIAQLERATSGE